MSLFREEVSEYRKLRLHGEVVLTQPLSTRLIVIAIFAIVAIAATWVSLGTYARIETVHGILVTDVSSAKVLASVPGVVTELHANEGQIVKQGDRLAVINLDRQASSGQTVVSRSLKTLEIRQMLTEKQIDLVHRRSEADRNRLIAVIKNNQQQAAQLREQIILQKQIIASNKNLFEQMSTIVERGFASKTDYERRRQTLLSTQQQLAGLQQQLSARMAEADQAQAQLVSIAAQSAQGSAEISSTLQSIAREQAQLEGERGYIVTAPISGRITALQTAPGRTAKPNVPLMVIVPEGSKLKAELYAPTRAVGFVKPGQEIRILYDAFPYQRFGSFSGRVENISRTIIDPRETELPIKLDEAVYRITVVLDAQDFIAYGDRVYLQAGMTLKATVVLERQSFLSWILRPLNAVLKRSS